MGSQTAQKPPRMGQTVLPRRGTLGICLPIVGSKKAAMKPGPDFRGSKKTGSRMWRCSVCRRQFANRNQSHFCGNYDLRSHFRRKSKEVEKLYKLFVAKVRRCGPVIILPEKSRIAFQVRMSFAAVQIQYSKIVGHLVLAERNDRPCFVRIDSISRRNHVHHFRIEKLADLDEEFCRLIQKAYQVGEQKHLKTVI